MYLIYESKEQMNTKDCSKYHPQGNYTQDLKSLFVTGMEDDVLKEMKDSEEEDDEKQ